MALWNQRLVCNSISRHNGTCHEWLSQFYVRILKLCYFGAHNGISKFRYFCILLPLTRINIYPCVCFTHKLVPSPCPFTIEVLMCLFIFFFNKFGILWVVAIRLWLSLVQVFSPILYNAIINRNTRINCFMYSQL